MNPIYWTGWFLFRWFFKIYLRSRVEGVENVPLEGPVLLVSNHASFCDPPLVGSSLPRPISYLARESLFRFPVCGWLLRKVNAVPVDRDGGGAAGLRVTLDRLNKGEALILFPEGTRTKDGQLQTARSGVGLVVIKTTAVVVPVRVFGSFEAMNRTKSFPRPRKVSLRFAPPLNFDSLRAEAKECSKPRLKEIYQDVADQIMAAIAAIEKP